MELDRELIRQARSLINGATVHKIGGLLLAYEVYPPGSPRSLALESLLRDFVRTRQRSNAMRNSIEAQRKAVNELSSKSGTLNREIALKTAGLSRRIEKLQTSTSD